MVKNIALTGRRRSSKPRTPGQEFVSFYILSKQRERLQREQERATQGIKHTLEDMAKIAKDIEKELAKTRKAREGLGNAPPASTLFQPQLIQY